jgi:transposase
LEAVKQMESGEYTQSDLARRLGVSPTLLCDWRKEMARKQSDAFPGHGKQRGDAAEISRLKRELEQVKEEREILKKAMAFFARESR